jgi:hypothetical protein
VQVGGKRAKLGNFILLLEKFEKKLLNLKTIKTHKIDNIVQNIHRDKHI